MSAGAPTARGAVAPGRARSPTTVGGRLLGAYAVAYLLFLFAPVLLLPVFAFNDGVIVGFPLQGFTLRWFVDLARQPALADAVVNSLMVGAVVAVVSTALGVLAARGATRFPFPGAQGAIGFVMAPLVLPEIIIAVSLVIVIVQLGLELSLLTVAAGQIVVATPYAIAILSAAFAGLDRSLEEAALDLGETRMSAFRRVTLPLVAPGVVSSLLLTFTISLDEFLIAFFLSGAEPTLPVYIWSQLRFPARLPAMMALGFLLLLLSLAILTAAELMRRRAAARAGVAAAPGGFG
jgi:spermidine/putrescine transport system permease protein